MNETRRTPGAGASPAPRQRQDLTARRSVRQTIAHGAEGYDRSRHLVRLIPIGPDELSDDSSAIRRKVLAKLARALRAERSRGRAGHWTYDLNRHLALSQAYAAEKRMAADAGIDSGTK